jgi:hypothetical protein
MEHVSELQWLVQRRSVCVVAIYRAVNLCGGYEGRRSAGLRLAE